tara:strand:+ start:195 stop:500 length:306 start_codon:yes stop_codon:yes gene_type:complete
MKIGSLEGLSRDDVVEVRGINGNSGPYVVGIVEKDRAFLQQLRSPDTTDISVSFGSRCMPVEQADLSRVEVYPVRDDRYSGWKHLYQSPDGPCKMIVKVLV